MANGSATVTGVDTTFLTSIYPGDLFTINESVFYEVLSVSDNLTFTLERPYEGETAGGLDYVVVPLSPKRQLTAELANRVNALIERYRASLEAWTAGGWEIDTNGDMQVAGTEDRDVVPRTNGGANVGTTTKRWGTVNTNALNVNGQAVSPKTTPTAYSVPVADANGDIADGWVPDTIARLASPALTGSPTAPTQTASDNSTKIATTKFVKDQAYFNKANILGTVSQSGGIPTGAVIERGSNANGEYVKFADGTMICVVAFTGEVTVSAYGTTGLYFGAAEATLPATFYEIQGGACGGQDQSWRGIFSYSITSTPTVGIATYFTRSPSVSSTNARFVFFGRWF